jgi:alpha-tubulin suppressor-like RCC1 family protein
MRMAAAAAVLLAGSAAGACADHGGGTLPEPPVQPQAGPVRHRVAAGGESSCSLNTAGTLFCWGALNALFPAGSPPTWTPMQIQGVPAFATISASYGGSYDVFCALTAAGDLWCDRNGSQFYPLGAGTRWTTVDVGPVHGCATAGDSTAWCFGASGEGELGVPGLASSAAPVRVAGGVRFTSVVTGRTWSCGVATSGAAYCWGQSRGGALGLGVGVIRSDTAAAVRGGLHFLRLSASKTGDHTCGITSQGDAYCWGAGEHGQLGDGAAGDSAWTPVLVRDGHTWMDIAAGFHQTCGVTTDHRAWCWGSDVAGERGTASGFGGPDQPTPALVGSGYAEIAAGGEIYLGGHGTSGILDQSHACAIAQDETVRCWGGNGFGQLGNGSYQPSDRPVTALVPR